MFQHILLCSDGSEHALKAARIAAEIARSGSKVSLLSVLDIAAATAPYMGQWETVICTDDLLNCASEAQAKAIADTGKVLKAEGVDYTPISDTGHPVDVIAGTAERDHCDLIVLGSRGMTQWEALLLGSVADGVARHAHRPVLIVRGDKPRFERILLASDGSEASCRAAKVAAEVACALDATLTVLNVYEQARSYEGISQFDPDPEVHEVKVMKAMRNATLAAIPVCGSVCDVSQEVGHPAEVIGRYADEHNEDVIVMGSRGLGAFKSFLLGSVSNRVMHYANKSVLIVH